MHTPAAKDHAIPVVFREVPEGNAIANNRAARTICITPKAAMKSETVSKFRMMRRFSTTVTAANSSPDARDA